MTRVEKSLAASYFPLHQQERASRPCRRRAPVISIRKRSSSMRPGKSCGFVSAVDGPAAKKGKDRRLQDETPDRASDDSSDAESVVDDEDLGEEGDDGMSSEEEDSIAPLPKKKKKKKSKKRRTGGVLIRGRGGGRLHVYSVLERRPRHFSKIRVKTPAPPQERRRSVPPDGTRRTTRTTCPHRNEEGRRRLAEGRALVREHARVVARRASASRRRVPSPGPPRRPGAYVRHYRRRRFQAAG